MPAPLSSRQEAEDRLSSRALPDTLLKGRGAVSNPTGRFETQVRTRTRESWDDSDERAPRRVEITVEKPRSILTRNTSPDIPFDRSINPYRGCEHGCSYCFARPTHAFLGLSPGLDFESKLYIKPNAAALLRDTLSRPGYRPKPIAIGTNTDPYQPIEKSEKIMRQILEVLAEADHPVTIVTKSAMVMRDLDILAPMAARNLVHVGISVTTLDRRLARLLEPRAATPSLRLEAIGALSAAGIRVTLLAAPIIPALNDMEIEQIVAAGAEAGAVSAGYILLRLPLEVRDVFRDWLAKAYPERYRHVMSLIRQMRGGKDYDAEWMKRMRGEGPYADLIARRFEAAIKRHGLTRRSLDLDCTRFRPPRPDSEQMCFPF